MRRSSARTRTRPPTDRSSSDRPTYFTCAGLLRYPDKPAPDGWVLEPEVAAAMPDGLGRRSHLHLHVRDGFAFSPPSNEPVTAATYRSTIERALSADLSDSGRGILFLADIEGAADFNEGRADHVSGIAVDGDTLSFTPDQHRRPTSCTA